MHADFNVDESPWPLREELERIDHQVTGLFHLASPAGPIHVVVMHSEGAYQHYMRTYFPTVPARRALFLRDRGPGMLFTYRHESLLQDLRHEVTHAILNDGRKPLPLWLDEGIAEYFEPEESDRYSRNSYLSEILGELRQGRITPIDQLVAIETLDAFHDVHYRHSWAWVHFMMHRSPESRALLIGYVRSYYTDPLFRLERALATQFPDVQEELRQHFSGVAAAQDE